MNWFFQPIWYQSNFSFLGSNFQCLNHTFLPFFFWHLHSSFSYLWCLCLSVSYLQCLLLLSLFLSTFLIFFYFFIFLSSFVLNMAEQTSNKNSIVPEVSNHLDNPTLQIITQKLNDNDFLEFSLFQTLSIKSREDQVFVWDNNRTKNLVSQL